MPKKALAERMQEATAPSLVPPDPVVAPPPKEVEVLPSIHDLVLAPSERIKLIQLIKEFNLKKALEMDAISQVWGSECTSKAIKDRKDYFSNSIKKYLGKWAVSKASCDGIRVNYFNSPRESIKEDLLTHALLKRGIAPDVIAVILVESTKKTDSYTLRVGGDEE